MSTTSLPMDAGGLNVIPSLPPQIPVSTELQQTLALLLGLYQGQRIPVRISQSGVVRFGASPLADVFTVTGVGANYTYQADRKPVSEVLVMAHPDNASLIWVRTRDTATVDNAFPLNAGDMLGFAVDSLDDLHLLIVGAGEKAIIGYTL